MQYALTGDLMPALEARQWGLVNQITPPGGAREAALAMAQQIASNGPLAVKIAKQIVTQSPTWRADEVWAKQNQLLEQVITSHDAREGAAAFQEKRQPVWTGT